MFTSRTVARPPCPSSLHWHTWLFLVLLMLHLLYVEATQLQGTYPATAAPASPFPLL